MTFKFSNKSLELLKEVNPRLTFLCEEVLKTTPIDFGIVQGERTLDYQAALYAQGRDTLENVNKLRAKVGLNPLKWEENQKTVTNTMKSNHLEQADGKSKAIDFGVYVNGKYINGDTAEEQRLYIVVVAEFKRRAKELGIGIRCGADWKVQDLGHVELI